MANGVSSSARSYIFRPYRSFGAIVVRRDAGNTAWSVIIKDHRISKNRNKKIIIRIS